MFNFDFDGDGIMDTVGIDSNGDGVIDTYHTEMNGMVMESYDYNQDGVIESQTIYHDYNHDGVFETVVKGYDSDGDGIIDDITTYQDLDGDGNEDLCMKGNYTDQDGDGVIDTYDVHTDLDRYHIYGSEEVYGIDNHPSLQAAGNIAGVCIDDLGNFDPEKADMSAVSGDPAQSMKEWEYQGDTGRCALYSQKFVIEELTNQEIDIEELADLAEGNGWFSESSGTPLLNMDKILDYYGIHSEMSFHNEISDLQNCLESGGKAIVTIDADEIWYGESDDLFTPGDGANHAVEVIGIDHSDSNEPMVILNDSGNPQGCGEMVPLDVFLDAWEDGNCQMISCR